MADRPQTIFGIPVFESRLIEPGSLFAVRGRMVRLQGNVVSGDDDFQVVRLTGLDESDRPQEIEAD